MTKPSTEEVRYVAELAKLSLSEEEIELFASQLSAVLEYAAHLQQVETSHVPPTATVLPLRSVMRRDEARPSLPVEAALANAPAREGTYFKVHAVLEESQ